MSNRLTICFMLVLTLFAGLKARGQGAPQYQTQHQTNISISILPGNVGKTNLTAFSTAASKRYCSLEFINLSAYSVYLICTNFGAGVFTNAVTNAIAAAGGIRLNPTGTLGDRTKYQYVIPFNGVTVGASSIGYAFQTDVLGAGSNSTGTVNIEGLGF